MIPGFRVRRHLLGDLSCAHPRHDPSFPHWVCPDCGSQIYSEMIPMQINFDRDAFLYAVSRLGCAIIEEEKARRSQSTSGAVT